MTTARSLFIGTFVGIFLLLSITYFAVAFTGPTLPPATESGIIKSINGNIGVSTTNPVAKFEVTTTGLLGQRINMSNPSNSAFSLDFNRSATNVQSAFNWSTAGTAKWFVGQDNDSTENFLFYNWTGSKFLIRGYDSTGNVSIGNDTIYAQNSGNVGIGNNNPQYKLDVTGNINFTGNLYQNGVLFTSGGNQWTSGSGVVYPTSTATNVAIGKTTATQKLDVEGNINIMSDGRIGLGGDMPFPPRAINLRSGYVGDDLYSGTIAYRPVSWDGNSLVIVGAGTASGNRRVKIFDTLVLGSLGSEPTGVPGMMYYNTTSGAFRCYATSTWGNCGG
ncbi:MAG: hypothetical protein AAB903_00695, partial [Patescibacteria group bacterium]